MFVKAAIACGETSRTRISAEVAQEVRRSMFHENILLHYLSFKRLVSLTVLCEAGSRLLRRRR